MSIHYRKSGAAIIIFGNTYPVREKIKALGARYDGVGKTWRIPLTEDGLALVHTLCIEHGGGPLGGSVEGARGSDQAEAEVLAVTLPPVTLPSRAGGMDELQLEHATVIATRKVDTTGLTIRELMERAALAVAGAFPASVWVLGEIQNVARRPSGMYLDLAEGREGAHQSATVTARAVIWSQALHVMAGRHGKDRIADVLQDGMKVRVLCQVQLYRDRGQISLVIEDVDPAYTKGALALAREKLLKELRQKGLDQANKQRLLTPFPLRLGLISADESRAKSDFLHQLWSHGFPGEVLFRPTPMQGDSVPKRVVAALKQLTQQQVDVIVITRGGGSAADLRWFDAAEIAYSIAACPIPIVAAIGHHDDVAVAEEICFMRQKTPTAAADFIVNWFARTKDRIDQMSGYLAQVLGRRVDEFSLIQAALGEKLRGASDRSLAVREGRLTTIRHALERQGLDRIGRAIIRLGQMAGDMQRSAVHAIGRREDKLRQIEMALTRKDPTPWLASGWTQLSGPRGPVRSIADVSLGDLVQARLKDGSLGLRVEQAAETSRTKKETPNERI